MRTKPRKKSSTPSRITKKPNGPYKKGPSGPFLLSTDRSSFELQMIHIGRRWRRWRCWPQTLPYFTQGQMGQIQLKWLYFFPLPRRQLISTDSRHIQIRNRDRNPRQNFKFILFHQIALLRRNRQMGNIHQYRPSLDPLIWAQ